MASGSAVPAKQRQRPPASLPSARRPLALGVGPRLQPRLSPRAQLPLGGGGALRRSAGASDGHAAEGESGMRRSCSQRQGCEETPLAAAEGEGGTRRA